MNQNYSPYGQYGHRPAQDPSWRDWRGMYVPASAIATAYGYQRPAVDVHDIARRMGVRLEYLQPSSNLSGALDGTVDPPVIYVRKGMAMTRERFTVAHELGHLILHDLGVEYRDDGYKRGDPKEAQANGWAAKLLMPGSMIAAEIGPVSRVSPLKVHRMAELFQVSTRAMTARLQKMQVAVR